MGLMPLSVTDETTSRRLVFNVTGVGMVGFFKCDRGWLGTGTHRGTLPSTANYNSGSNCKTLAGGSPHDLDTTLFRIEQGEKLVIFYRVFAKRRTWQLRATYDYSLEDDPFMKILFLHGWHSTPGGLKPSFLDISRA